jgi:AraC-like DNA-binding protein
MDKKVQELFYQADDASCEESILQDAIHSFIKNSQDHNFQVTELSKYLCMSERNFRRKCQKLFSKSPADLIAVYRIEKSKQLLAKGQPVSDVAHQLKYSSTSHFSKVFKALVGVSPSGYIKSLYC